jgi:cytoskeletal protein RodZ
MTGFGEDLKRERENRGITLESLAAETRVQLRHLAALEQGEYETLPGGLFRRSIARAYLTAAGLEEQTWLPRFEQSLREHSTADGAKPAPDGEAWATFAENVKRNRSGGAPSHRLRWLGVLALLVLITALAWAVWHFLLQGRTAG